MIALYTIIAAANLFMFVFIAGRADLGAGRPILAGVYFVLAVMWLFVYITDIKAAKGDALEKKQSRSQQLKERLRNDGSRAKR